MLTYSNTFHKCIYPQDIFTLCRVSSITVDKLKAVLEANPDAAKERDDKGNTPLHILYGNSSRSDDVVRFLLDANPEAKDIRNEECLTPLNILEDATVYKPGDGVKYYEDKSLKKLVIHKDVTHIVEKAFTRCSNLESIDWGESEVKKIGQIAFR